MIKNNKTNHGQRCTTRYKIPQNMHYMTRITIDKHVLDNNKNRTEKHPHTDNTSTIDKSIIT